MSTSPLALDHVVVPRICGNKILDVGCGYGKWGFLAKKYFWAACQGSSCEEPFIAGLDCHQPNLDGLRAHRLYDELIRADAAYLPFRNKSFDTVLAIEVMEHLREEAGYQALQEFERVAKQCIILSTPNKKCFRDGLTDVHGYNPYEAHRSRWKIKTFKSLGYRFYGLGSKLWPRWFWSATELTYFSYRIPMVSDTLVCIKCLKPQ